MSKMLIFHDTFLMKGGAERMNIDIAKFLKSDIATATWSSSCYDPRSMGFEGEIIEMNPSFRKGIIGFLFMKWSFFRSKILLSGYDTIFFSNEAISGIWNITPGTRTYYYAHSISRHLFDQRDQYAQKVPLLVRPFFLAFTMVLKWLYRSEIARVGTIFVNSAINKKRMSDWLGRDDAIILYPSVDLEKFKIYPENEIMQTLAKENISLSHKGYYISFSRLTTAKQIDRIILAFQKMPDANLLVLYGENDSQKDEFQKMGIGYPNIIFRSLSDNENLPLIIGGSIASISVSKHEDFGMVAIESMACGIPAIVTDEGGYCESVVHNKTGFLIDPDNITEHLIDLIENTPRLDYGTMQQDCLNQAEKFSLQHMQAKLEEYL